MSFLEFTEDERLPVGSSATQGEKQRRQTVRPNYKAALAWAIGTLLAAGVLLYIAAPKRVSPPQQIPLTISDARSDSQAPITRPIETIRVGDRVIARNPQVSDAERAAFSVEPDFSQWLWLKLEMPKADGGVLRVEMLRPETWLLDQIGFVVEDRRPRLPELTEELLSEATSDERAEVAAEVDPAAPLVSLSPLRTIYREIGRRAALLNESGIELRGLTVELDLPEMGAVGTAVIADIGPCPAIQSQEAAGGGHVVTATVQHPASEQVLDVSFSGAAEPIGVTANHLFYSADRQEFIPIGEMEIGERVQTFEGETRRITQKLPRPGPATVYNLEVYGEHVYYVGNDGILTHNSCSKYVYIIRDTITKEVKYVGITNNLKLREIAHMYLKTLRKGEEMVAITNKISHNKARNIESGLIRKFIDGGTNPKASLVAKQLAGTSLRNQNRELVGIGC